MNTLNNHIANTLLMIQYAGSKVSGAGASTSSSPSTPAPTTPLPLSLYESTSCLISPRELLVKVSWRAFSVLSWTRNSGGSSGLVLVESVAAAVDTADEVDKEVLSLDVSKSLRTWRE